ncbi:MAG: VCBS repeat-containing protein, partial [Gemmatimonadota bacterium]
AVYLGLGSGRFEEGIPFGADEHTYAAAVADMDRDGDADIVVGNVQGQNAVYLNDGSGRVWVEQKVGEEAEATYGVATADLDGDGYPDIGFANSEAVNRLFFNVGR